MNTTSLSLLMAAALLPALAEAETAAPQQVVITAPKHRLSTPAVLAEVGQRSAYEMSDGHTLVIEGRGRLLRVRHAGRALHYLRPDGDGSFVSADRQVALQMTRGERGDAVVRLSYPAPAL